MPVHLGTRITYRSTVILYIMLGTYVIFISLAPLDSVHGLVYKVFLEARNLLSHLFFDLVLHVL